MWPKKRLSSSLIQKLKKPEENWPLYPTTLIKQYDTYEEARNKEIAYSYTSAESDPEGELNLGKGKRRKRAHVYSSSSGEEDINPSGTTRNASPSLEKIKKNLDGANTSKYWKIEENISRDNLERLLERFCETTDTTKSLVISSNNDAETFLTNEISVCEEATTEEQDVTPSISSEMGTSSQTSLHKYLIELNKNTVDIKTHLKIIDSRLNNIENKIEKNYNTEYLNSKELPKFPLATIEELTDFDQKLKEEDYIDAMTNYINNIGGLDVKSFIRRSLKTIFTNDLAQKCSWCGQKGNFVLKNLNLMSILKETIRKTYCKMTNKEFEVIVMEWFRHGKSRLVREKKERNIIIQ